MSDHLERLTQRLAQEDRLLTAFSGGADSALLAACAHMVLADRALAVTAVSASLPARDRAGARDFAHGRGMPHIEVCTDELQRLFSEAETTHAALVTTAKDAVRLPAEWRAHVEVLSVRAEFDDAAALDRCIDRVVAREG